MVTNQSFIISGFLRNLCNITVFRENEKITAIFNPSRHTAPVFPVTQHVIRMEKADDEISEAVISEIRKINTEQIEDKLHSELLKLFEQPCNQCVTSETINLSRSSSFEEQSEIEHICENQRKLIDAINAAKERIADSFKNMTANDKFEITGYVIVSSVHLFPLFLNSRPDILTGDSRFKRFIYVFPLLKVKGSDVVIKPFDFSCLDYEITEPYFVPEWNIGPAFVLCHRIQITRKYLKKLSK